MGRRAGAETVARLLQLHTTRGEWGQVELADRLGVTTRTIRETMVVLAAAGLPVERVELSGRSVTWRVGPVVLGSRLEPASPGPPRVSTGQMRGALGRIGTSQLRRPSKGLDAPGGARKTKMRKRRRDGT